ncbi:MAG: methyltransferase domain-containing protein [Candidatus Muirbacterium halophilum]|nr:methyltransferase domain-containing protein [Candidatus Muirbacterium halophilum]MCK9477359.1 methyltransferase domain-containing protein [Candidatus Muirbacterium halophilum]
MSKLRELYDNAAQKDKSIKKATFYSNEDIPEHFKTEVFGCGNPVRYIQGEFSNKVVLDIGCGAGIDIYYLSKKFKQSLLIGLDFSLDMLKRSKVNCEKSGVEAFFIQADIKHLPFKKEVINTILSNACIHLIREKEQFFNESFRVLKENSEMIISDIQTYKPWKNPFFLEEYKQTDGVFLYGGVEDKESYFNKLSNSKIQYNIIKEEFFNPSADILPTVKAKHKNLSSEIEKEFKENLFILTDYIAWKGDKKKFPAFVKCDCGEENIFDFYPRIPYGSKLFKKLKNNKINIVKCKKCSKLIENEDSFMITRPPKEVIFKFPEKWENVIDLNSNELKIKDTKLKVIKIFKNSELYQLINKETILKDNFLTRFIKRLF